MANESSYLHSHSGLERDLKIPKRIVLVDEQFKDRFIDAEPCKYHNVNYVKVPILSFIKQGGVFKNLNK